MRPCLAVRAGSGKQLMDDLRAEMARLKERQVSGLKADAILSDRTTRTRSLVFLLSGILNIGILVWGYRRIAETLKQRDVALRESSMRGFELQQQKDLLSVTLSSIGDCVLVTDKEGRITFMNPVAEEVTGWKLNEAMGRPTSDVFRILNEHTRAPVENPVEKVMKHGVIVGLANHTVLIRKDGSEIPIDDSGAPIRDSNGGIRGVVLVFRDFSEHKQAEQELRSRQRGGRNRQQGEGPISRHAFPRVTHATYARPGHAESLGSERRGSRNRCETDVQMLRRSIELEARIIDDLLDLTRVARGMLSFSPENTDVHAVLEFLVGLSQSEFQNKELKVTLNLDASRHHVHTDAARLQQVVLEYSPQRHQIHRTRRRGNDYYVQRCATRHRHHD